jgi:hypothetical protein
MRFAFALLSAFALSGPASAQTITFDPFSIGSFETSDIYDIDANFAARYGRNVPAAVRVLVPRHDDLFVQVAAVPDTGGLVGFAFFAEGETPDDLAFLGNLELTDATIPMVPDAEDEVHERRVIAARLLEEQLFPQYANRYQNAEILAIEAVELGNATGALQLVARYFDQEFDTNTMLRAVILPHPTQAESYLAVATINLDLVSVTDADTLAATISGRVLGSWEYR